MPSRTENIDTLSRHINDISRQVSEKELFNLVTRHLVGQFQESLFTFDYAVVSTIDFFSCTINSLYSRRRNGSPSVDPKRWQGLSSYNYLQQSDILTYVLDKKKPIVVDGGKIIGEKNEKAKLEDPHPLLNKRIYHKYNHKELRRLFVPVIRRQPPKTLRKLQATDDRLAYTKADYFLAILEVAYHNSRQEQLDPQTIDLVMMYADNIAQPYYTIILDGIRDTSKQIATDNSWSPSASLQANRHNFHRSFVNGAVDDIRHNLGVNKVDISFFSLSDKGKTVPEYPITFGSLTPEELKLSRSNSPNQNIKTKDTSVFTHVLKKRQTFICHDTTRDKKFKYRLKDVRSQISVPLFYNETCVAILSLYHHHPNKFNYVAQEFLESLGRQCTSEYFRLKLLYFQQKLVSDFNYEEATFLDFVKRIITDVLRDYFLCKSVAYFEYDKELSLFSSLVGTGDLIQLTTKTVFLSENIAENNDDIFFEKSIDDIINEEKDDYLQKSLKSFGASSLLFIPIHDKTTSDRVGLFALLLFRSIRLFPEDYIMIQSVIDKVSAAFINYDLYDELHNSIKELGELAVKANIAREALELIHSANHSLEALFVGMAIYEQHVPHEVLSPEAKSKLSSARSLLAQSFEELEALGEMQTFKLKPKKPLDLLIELIKPYRLDLKREKIAIQIDVSDKIANSVKVLVEMDRLKHVFLNLIRNSIYAISNKSNVKGMITLKMVDFDNEFVELQFRDNGVGFDDTALKRAFREKYSSKGQEGTGLGLLTIGRIIREDLKGELEVESKKGEYAMIKIRLNKQTP